MKNLSATFYLFCTCRLYLIGCRSGFTGSKLTQWRRNDNLHYDNSEEKKRSVTSFNRNFNAVDSPVLLTSKGGAQISHGSFNTRYQFSSAIQSSQKSFYQIIINLQLELNRLMMTISSNLMKIL